MLSHENSVRLTSVIFISGSWATRAWRHQIAITAERSSAKIAAKRLERANAASAYSPCFCDHHGCAGIRRAIRQRYGFMERADRVVPGRPRQADDLHAAAHHPLPEERLSARYAIRHQASWHGATEWRAWSSCGYRRRAGKRGRQGKPLKSVYPGYRT